MSRTRRCVLLVLLCALLGGVPSVTIAPDRAAAAGTYGAPTPTGQVALTWAPTYMSDNHYYTQAEAEAVARRFDLVAAMPIAFQKYVGRMRTVNPDVVLMSYANATLAQPRDVASLPESAFAHDQYGRRITANGFGTNLMESSSAAWRRTALQQCDARVAQSGFDGCLLDMLTLGIFAKGFVTGLPVKPGTSTPYTQAEYRDQMASLARAYRVDSPGLIHVGNAVENSYRYWRASVQSRPLARSMPATQMEDFLRGAKSGVNAYPSAADWLHNVDVVRDLESAGVTGLFTTKLWVGATAAEAAAWDSYAMASFLMGANGRSYFAFTRSRDKAGASGTNLPYQMPRQIGLPTGAMYQTGSGAYLRRFAHGVSVVNPGSTWVSVDLGGTYRTLDGRTLSKLSLAPHSGDVLVSSSYNGTPTVDTTPPSGTHGWKNVAPWRLQVGGSATDDVAVASAQVAVRSETTHAWLRRDGSWGSYQLLPASLAQTGVRSTTWSKTLSLPPGRYGVALVVNDTAGNANRTPRPWVVATVPAA